MILVLLRLTAIIASLAFSKQWPPISETLLHPGGGIVAFSELAWVGHAVYALGRITYRRLQGALVVYLSFAAIFASAYGVIWELMPGAFGSTQATMRRPRR